MRRHDTFHCIAAEEGYLDTRSRALLTGMMNALPVRRAAGKSSIYHRVEDICVSCDLISETQRARQAYVVWTPAASMCRSSLRVKL